MIDKKERVTIAFFLPSLEPGGTERNVVNLINNIDRKKYRLSLVLGEAGGDFTREVNKGIPIVNLDVSYTLGLFFKLIKYFKKEEPDIFVSAFPRINIVAIIARILSGKKTKIVITEHTIFSFLPIIAKTFWRRFFARVFLPGISKFVYPKADAIICVSNGIADDLLKIIRCSEKVRVIYNPVTSAKIYKLAKEPLSHSWFSNSKIPVIIAVGRLVKCKDYPNIFRAFSLILQKEPARLVILGRGPEKEKLIQLADKLDLSKNIAFLGFQKNPYKYMKKASVFVLSSLQEGFGNVIIEAMACGTPVVSTNCPAGPDEIIENGKNGILVSVGDYKELAKAIQKVLNSPFLRKKFSDEGKNRAQDFSIINSVKQYEEVFLKIMSSSFK